MNRRLFVAALFCGLGVLLLRVPSARAEEIPAEYKPCIAKGFKWLCDNQNRDGHWESAGQYPIVITSISGMALLMEGSTIREGKYADRIKRATDWLMSKAISTGQIGNPQIAGEAGRYMYGHGFAVLFLSCVYGEEEEPERRKKLEKILTEACKFIRNAQTTRGGWGYVSAKDSGQDFDEGSVTVTQMQALRAARNAGIAVPKDAIDDGVNYLKKSTENGGVIYSLASGGRGQGSHALTAAAMACGFSAGEYNNPTVKEWIKFCQGHLGPAGGGINRIGHDEYTHYYFSQAVYFLGDTGYAKLFPTSKESERLIWTKYRKESFANIKASQNADGSWTGSQVGPGFATPVYLSILQLDNAALPIYQR